MHHHLEVSLTPRKSTPPLLECRTRKIGLSLFRRLFGGQRIVILFPGDSVDEVTIIEQPQVKAPGYQPS